MRLPRKRFVLLLAGAALVMSASALSLFPRPPGRPDARTLPGVGPADRLLVLAPHEDDETLGAGGMIQQALATGAAVRVLYLTYGDHNQMAFMVYRKWPVLTPAGNRAMGYLRHQEAVAATEILGLRTNDLVFLGYPDLGELPIWESHWGDAVPFHSLLINASAVPYTNAYACGQDFKGENILAGLKALIRDYQPTRILVSHPADGHPDHRAFFLFLQVALLDLQEDIPPPEMYVYPVHAGSWPAPTGFHPEQWLAIPPRLADSPDPWFMFELPPDQVLQKQRAILAYTSQIANAEAWMLGFARRNELYMRPLPLDLTGNAGALTDFADANAETDAYLSETARDGFNGLSYSATPDALVLSVSLRGIPEVTFGMFLHAYAYRRDTPFEKMPKINIFWSPTSLNVYDQGARLPVSAVRASRKDRQLIVTIPWETLKNPDSILAEAHGMAGKMRVSQTSWRLLRRSPGKGQP